MSTATTLEALAEPSRRRLVELLRGGERSVTQLTEGMHLTQPAVSKHLRVLRDHGLVDVRTDAQRRLYRIRPEPLMELDVWLGSYRSLWSESLDRLEHHLDERSTDA